MEATEAIILQFSEYFTEIHMSKAKVTRVPKY